MRNMTTFAKRWTAREEGNIQQIPTKRQEGKRGMFNECEQLNREEKQDRQGYRTESSEGKRTLPGRTQPSEGTTEHWSEDRRSSQRRFKKNKKIK